MASVYDSKWPDTVLHCVAMVCLTFIVCKAFGWL